MLNPNPGGANSKNKIEINKITIVKLSCKKSKQNLVKQISNTLLKSKKSTLQSSSNSKQTNNINTKNDKKTTSKNKNSIKSNNKNPIFMSTIKSKGYCSAINIHAKKQKQKLTSIKILDSNMNVVKPLKTRFCTLLQDRVLFNGDLITNDFMRTNNGNNHSSCKKQKRKLCRHKSEILKERRTSFFMKTSDKERNSSSISCKHIRKFYKKLLTVNTDFELLSVSNLSNNSLDKNRNNNNLLTINSNLNSTNKNNNGKKKSFMKPNFNNEQQKRSVKERVKKNNKIASFQNSKNINIIGYNKQKSTTNKVFNINTFTNSNNLNKYIKSAHNIKENNNNERDIKSPNNDKQISVLMIKTLSNMNLINNVPHTTKANKNYTNKSQEKIVSQKKVRENYKSTNNDGHSKINNIVLNTNKINFNNIKSKNSGVRNIDLKSNTKINLINKALKKTQLNNLRNNINIRNLHNSNKINIVSPKKKKKKKIEININNLSDSKTTIPNLSNENFNTINGLNTLSKKNLTNYKRKFNINVNTANNFIANYHSNQNTLTINTQEIKSKSNNKKKNKIVNNNPNFNFNHNIKHSKILSCSCSENKNNYCSDIKDYSKIKIYQYEKSPQKNEINYNIKNGSQNKKYTNNSHKNKYSSLYNSHLNLHNNIIHFGNKNYNKILPCDPKKFFLLYKNYLNHNEIFEIKQLNECNQKIYYLGEINKRIKKDEKTYTKLNKTYDQIGYDFINDNINEKMFLLHKMARVNSSLNLVPHINNKIEINNNNEDNNTNKFNLIKKLIPDKNYDDGDGDYIINIGNHLDYRYEIICLLGKGSFGEAIKCYDHKNKETVCIKMINSKQKFQQQAEIEIKILETISNSNFSEESCNVKYYDYFLFRNHICLVFELLGSNLYQILQKNNFTGMKPFLIRNYCQDILFSLLFLKTKNIIHCDLKPENILLIPGSENRVKLIDFGSSCFNNEQLYLYIQSRFYRAPEVILDIGYSYPIDMWSLGCIIYELYVGDPLFPGINETEQIYFIMEYLGSPPLEFIEASPKISFLFNDEDYFNVQPKRDIKNYLLNGSEELIDFIKKCIIWEPYRRLTPEEGLLHPYIIKGMSQLELKKHKQKIERIKNGFSNYKNYMSENDLLNNDILLSKKPITENRYKEKPPIGLTLSKIEKNKNQDISTLDILNLSHFYTNHKKSPNLSETENCINVYNNRDNNNKKNKVKQLISEFNNTQRVPLHIGIDININIIRKNKKKINKSCSLNKSKRVNSFYTNNIYKAKTKKTNIINYLPKKKSICRKIKPQNISKDIKKEK